MLTITPQSTKWLLLVLFLLVGTSTGLLQRQREKQNEPPNYSKQPEFQLQDFLLTNMDPQGNPDYQLQADTMVHYQVMEESLIENPYITIFKGAAPPWKIHAKQGQISGNGEVVTLLKEVQIHREKGKNNQYLQVITRDLSINTKSSLATTKKKVTLRSPGQQVQGVGMQFYYKKPVKIILLSKVRGTHETK